MKAETTEIDRRQNFGSGFYQGITGFVTQPYKGAKEEGALGFLKGAGKGSIGLFAKPGSGTLILSRYAQNILDFMTDNGSAMFGLMAYPAQGIYRSIKAAQGSEHSVMKSKCAMVDKLAAHGAEQNRVDEVVKTFDNLSK